MINYYLHHLFSCSWQTIILQIWHIANANAIAIANARL
jgi:hypothetical protein